MLGRDGTHNAVSPEKDPPIRWNVKKPENILWQARLGDNGFAPPIVSGGLVWIGTNNQRPRDPHFKDVAAVLMCFRASDGQFLWQYLSPRLENEHQDGPGLAIRCAPLDEGDRLFFTTNRWEVVCLDIGPLKRGKGEPRLLWKLDMIEKLGVAPVGGHPGCYPRYTPSLALYKDRLYTLTGNGVDEAGTSVPAPNAPSLICLDRNSGKVLWHDKSPGKNILEGQWSSPLVIEVKGRAQVIAAQGDGWVRSFDALTGKPIWQFDSNPKDAVWNPRNRNTTTRNFFLATPVYAGGRVYIANGQGSEFATGPGRLFCIDPTREGDVSPELPDGPGKGKPNPNSAAVWCFEGKGGKRAESMQRTTSNVVVHEGLVIAPVVEGYVHCLDAKTGQRYWTHDVKAIITASPLVVDGKIFIGDHDGNVAVLALAKEKKVLAVNETEETITTSPVFANGILYVATDSKLFAIKAEGKSERTPGHWPQWRGPDRSNVSREEGLLKRWPKDGPPLAWKVEGLGQGAASLSIAGGRVYTLGYRDEHERLTALDETTGKPVWSVTLGPAVKEIPVRCWLAQRTPTIDEERIFAMTACGEVVCLRSTDGKVLWRKSYPKDLGGRQGRWGFGDRPLVDGDALICVPGGKEATIAALNKKTGDVLWKCPLPEEDSPEYGATVLSHAGNIRQYVVVLSNGLAGVAAKDGKLLWRYERVCTSTGNCYSPIPINDRIFCAGSYGKGYALLDLTAAGGGVAVKEQYYHRTSLSRHETAIQVETQVFVSTAQGMMCLDVETGQPLWKERGEVGNVESMTCADGHLYLRAQEGTVALIEASTKKYVLKGTLKIPGAQPKRDSTAPVVAGGRLYLRDEDRMFVYDVKEGVPPGKPGSETVPPPDKPPPPHKDREPDAVYVPTPQDVVEKMLELANVKKEETVYDLGCGDGRIVITAAKKYGCRANGYDIDAECVKMSRENVRKADVGKLVTIERKNLFSLDLAGADVIALYLLPRMNERLIPQLEKLKPGSRIVCHANAIPGVRADQVVSIVSKEDDVPHKVYLYTLPLKKETK